MTAITLDLDLFSTVPDDESLSRMREAARRDREFLEVMLEKPTQRPLPPHNGTEGSRDGARRVQSTGEALTMRERVLAVIALAGDRGITRADIAGRLSYPISSVCARVAEVRESIEELTGAERRIPDCGGSVRQGVLRVRREVEL